MSELERLLREPGCPACRYLGEIERSFFSWFQIENYTSPQIQAQLRAALGMCPVHSRRLLEEFGEGHITTTVLREALSGALRHLRGQTQIGACPACEAFEAGSRRACSLVLEGLLDPAMARRYSEHGGMCLVHILEALPHADPPRLGLLAERLLARLYEEVGPPLVAVLAGSDDDAGRRAHWRERLPELTREGSTVDRLRDLLEIDACPVCLSAAVAERDYCRWFLSHSAGGDRSLSRDPGEFCPRHLHDVALTDSSPTGGQALERKRAARIAHLERFLARLSQLPPGRRHGRRGRCDELDQVRVELLATPHCVACHAREGVELSRLELTTASLSLVPVRERYETRHGLCLRHAAQVPDGHSARVARRHLEGRLSLLAWELGETARKYAWAYRHEAGGPERDAWLRALAQIDGRVFMGAPAPPGEAVDSPHTP